MIEKMSYKYLKNQYRHKFTLLDKRKLLVLDLTKPT